MTQTEFNNLVSGANIRTAFKFGDLVPSVNYQIFGLENYLMWDDEGLNYVFTSLSSTNKWLPYTSEDTITPDYTKDTIEEMYAITDMTTGKICAVGKKTYKKATVNEGEITWDDYEHQDGESIQATVTTLPTTVEEGHPATDDIYCIYNPTYYKYESLGPSNISVVSNEPTIIWNNYELQDSDTVSGYVFDTLPENPNNNDIYGITGMIQGYKKYVSSTTSWVDYTPGTSDTIKGYVKTVSDLPTTSLTDGDIYGIAQSLEYKKCTKINTTNYSTNYEFNKYGKITPNVDVNVTITPNAVLKSMFGDITTVTVDGKDFDINYLNSAIKLSMNVDHRISIKWTPSLVETFRLICNR